MKDTKSRVRDLLARSAINVINDQASGSVGDAAVNLQTLVPTNLDGVALIGSRGGSNSKDELKQRGEPVEPIEFVLLLFETQRINIGLSLEPQQRERLIAFLRSNVDVFAWSANDMPGVDPQVMVH